MTVSSYHGYMIGGFSAKIQAHGNRRSAFGEFGACFVFGTGHSRQVLKASVLRPEYAQICTLYQTNRGESSGLFRIRNKYFLPAGVYRNSDSAADGAKYPNSEHAGNGLFAGANRSDLV